MNIHPILQIIQDQKQGVPRGICSVCSAHPMVLLACMEQAKEDGLPLLIEATANQINQYGGYTRMLPLDFAQLVFRLAEEAGLDRSRIILGGDHLGPLVWACEPERSAMDKAETLIRLFVLAGFTKIHIDTSMYLGSDDKHAALSDETIARRSARLASAAESAFAELQSGKSGVMPPVYVIGSEVPIPGGAQAKEEGVSVTEVESAMRTVTSFEKAYAAMPEAWSRVAALVVQPGVEFGDEDIFTYDRAKARKLTDAGKALPHMVFEGHSTDYQTPQALKSMVEDGIAILKVGPALTFALREGLFALSDIEAALGSHIPCPANFKAVLEEAMLADPSNWAKYYRGTDDELRFKRQYSLSDRARYYLASPAVNDAINQLLDNLANIPLSLVSQFFPAAYPKVRTGELALSAKALLFERIKNCIRDYTYAITP